MEHEFLSKKEIFDYQLKEKWRRQDRYDAVLRRIDIMVLTLSGGGLVVVLQTLKFILEHNLETDRHLLKLSAALLTAALCVDLYAVLSTIKQGSARSRAMEANIQALSNLTVNPARREWRKRSRIVAFIHALAFMLTIVGIALLLGYLFQEL